jgi:alpha-amylase
MRLTRRHLAALLLLLTACGGPIASGSPPGSVIGSGAAGPSPSASESTTATCQPAPSLPTRWWDDRVFYEVFVRSFRDSDADGIGDLAGLTEKLDYLNDGDPTTTDDLGLTGLWLMPVAEAASYHGYDVTDYRAIESDYGTADAFRALVEAAHERGIAIIVDLVMNHTSRDHPWFRDAITAGSVHDDWYVWSEDDPGYGGPDGQKVWHSAGNRFYYGLFWEGMPDLDLTNPQVEAEMDAVARYWLEDLGVDGFRLDAIKHFVEDGESQEDTDASHAWLAGFHDRVRTVDPEALLVGEVFDISLISSSYVPDAVDMTFDFELASTMLRSSSTADAGSVRAVQRAALERYADGQYAAFLTNHDQDRVMSQLGGDAGAARVAASLLLTNPGLPFVYYGEEIGLTGRKPDERIRTPLPWDATNPAAGFSEAAPWEALEAGWETRNVASQAADPASLLAHYRSLIHLRSEIPALHTGTWSPIAAGDRGVYAFLARGTNDVAAVVINLSDSPVTDYALEVEERASCPGAWQALYADGYRTVPEVQPQGIPGYGATVAEWLPVPELPARSTLVLRLSP